MSWYRMHVLAHKWRAVVLGTHDEVELLAVFLSDLEVMPGVVDILFEGEKKAVCWARGAALGVRSAGYESSSGFLDPSDVTSQVTLEDDNDHKIAEVILTSEAGKNEYIS